MRMTRDTRNAWEDQTSGENHLISDQPLPTILIEIWGEKGRTMMAYLSTQIRRMEKEEKKTHTVWRKPFSLQIIS